MENDNANDTPFKKMLNKRKTLTLLLKNIFQLELQEEKSQATNIDSEDKVTEDNNLIDIGSVSKGNLFEKVELEALIIFNRNASPSGFSYSSIPRA